MKKIVLSLTILTVASAFCGSPDSLLEYLTCTGKQYIDTGVCPGKTTRAVMKLRTTDTGTDKMTFGVRNAGYGFLCWFGKKAGTIVNPCIGTSSNLGEKNTGFASGDVWTLDFSLDGVVATGTAGGEEVTTTPYDAAALSKYSTDAVSSKTLMLFGLSSNGTIDSRKYVGDCYSFQLYDGGKLVRDLVPCMKGETVCMYNMAYDPADSATGDEYYMNKGTDAFGAGPKLAGDDTLLVTGAPSNYPVAVQPKYGTRMGLASGEELEVSAPAEQVLEAGKKAVCTGWKRYEWNADASAYEFVDSGVETSFTYTHPGKLTQLEWQFEVHYFVTLEGENVSLDRDSQWVPSGSELTVTATVADGYDWYGWHGDVAREQTLERTLTLTVDRPIALSALAVPGGITPGPSGKVVYVSDVGNDENDGTSWATAKLSVGPAAAALADGDTLVIGEGTFPISEPIELKSAATIRGVGMFKTIITSASDTQDTRGMLMNNADAVIEDLAFTGFARRTGGYDYFGLGLYIDKNGGTARRCRFYGNTGMRLRAHGQGVYMVAGSLYGCVIDHNITSTDCGGGGLYMNGKTAYAENCLICDNVAGDGNYKGGGVWLQSGTMVNCTIASNTIKNGAGGGVWIGTDKNNPAAMYNCVIWGNSAPNDGSVYAPDVAVNGNADPAKYLFNCLYGNATSEGCVALDPEFVDAANCVYSLKPNSPAIDAGSDEKVACQGTVDLAGNPRRVGVIDMGCYETDTTVFSCGFTVSKTEVFAGDSVTLKATVRGAQGDIGYEWTALEQDGVLLDEDDAVATATFTKPGRYGFTLTVTDSAAGSSVSATREAYVYAVPKSVTLAVGDDLQTAVDAAIDGSEIVLEDGTHTVPSQVTIDKAVRIVGAGYDVCTIANQSKTTRVLYVNNPGAVVSGVTITGGSQGVPRYSYGMGVWIGANGGTVTNCCITGNKAAEYYQIGGGVGLTGDRALLTHCIVCSNTVIHANSNSTGGGIALSAGTVDTCLVFDNESAGVGGGLATTANARPYGTITVRNSTFTRNTARTYGGGVWIKSDTKNSPSACIENCVFAGNSAPNDTLLGAPEWSPEYNATAKTQADNYKTATNVFFTCAFYLSGAPGEGSVAVGQPFASPNEGDFHLLAGNGAVDAGTWYEGIAADLELNPRDDKPDIGCYELDKSQFTCSFAISPEVVFNDELVAFTPTVQNPPENLTYTWTLTDRFGAKTVLKEVAPTQTIDKCGWYGVKLQVADANNPSKLAEFEVATALHVAPHDLYAVGGGANPTMAYPFDSEEKGHTNLIELAEEMIDGTRVHLGEGEFVVNAEFAVTVGATVTGAGMDKTVIRYVRPTNTSMSRVLRLNHPQCVVEKLTVTGGYFDGANNQFYNLWGSGAFIDSKGGTLQDCRITGNRSSTYHTIGGLGVKSTAGYVHRCVIDNNRQTVGTAYGSGIGLADGYIDNCLVVSNTAYEGAGVYMNGSNHAELRNCTVADNFIVNAKSVTPGGLYMNGCGDDVKVSNCIFWGNSAGAAATKGNCTGYPEFHMLWNSGTYALDSARAKAALLNCLMGVDLESLGATSLGTDGKADDPKFLDAAAGDYHLSQTSPCVNGGINRDYTRESMDLDGNPRIYNFGRKSSRADIGCYETPWGSPGFLLMVR